MNWSTSSIVLSFPKLIRNVDRLILSSSPIALSTFEGFIIPAKVLKAIGLDDKIKSYCFKYL